jgi:hypothetical protein
MSLTSTARVKKTESMWGGDIMIHGNKVSIGCVAVGDEAAEDLFTLASDVGIQNINVIIAPSDWRRGHATSLPAHLPKWVDGLHGRIRQRMDALPLPAHVK